MAFSTTLKHFHAVHRVTFSDRGLMRGIMSKTMNGEKTYHTSNQRRFDSYHEAKVAQREYNKRMELKAYA